MLEEKIDVGEADEQEQEIDLDKPVETPKEEKIEVEEAPVVETEEKPAEEGKEELSEYSEGVNKRIAKLTRKMREAERQKEEAITYARGQKDTAERMRRRYDSLDTDYNKEFEKRVTTNIDAVKTKLAQAINAGDIEKQVEAQTELSQLTMDATRLARMKEMDEKPVPDHMKPPAGQVQQPQQPQQPQRPPDPRADAWAKKNAWFGTDNAMTYTAFDIHKKLVEEEGYDGSSDEYYAEVDKRIRLDFPHKFDKVDQSTSAPVQNVASASRPAAKGRRRTVKLTPSQVAISKRLGVPLEEYAKQLTAMEDTA
tara:strand:+ start:110 stop:1042 length:933 start_codon:yes stop_codon:yes gene_type:complete